MSDFFLHHVSIAVPTLFAAIGGVALLCHRVFIWRSHRARDGEKHVREQKMPEKGVIAG